MAGTREAAARARAKTDREVVARFRNEELLSMQPLRFRDGDCYSPHDLTPAEQRHYMFGGNKKVQERDLTAVAGINPLDCYRVGLHCFFFLVSFRLTCPSSPSFPRSCCSVVQKNLCIPRGDL